MPEQTKLGLGILPNCQVVLKVGGKFPAWFRPTAKTPLRHIDNVVKGLHPHGLDLGDENKTCRSCSFGYKKSKGGWACDNHLPMSCGRHADRSIKLKWRACKDWELM